jgi:hypothetical protein
LCQSWPKKSRIAKHIPRTASRCGVEDLDVKPTALQRRENYIRVRYLTHRIAALVDTGIANQGLCQFNLFVHTITGFDMRWDTE